MQKYNNKVSTPPDA